MAFFYGLLEVANFIIKSANLKTYNIIAQKAKYEEKTFPTEYLSSCAINKTSQKQKKRSNESESLKRFDRFILKKAC